MLYKCFVFAGNERCPNDHNDEVMPGQRLRRWPDIRPALRQRILFNPLIDYILFFSCFISTLK